MICGNEWPYIFCSLALQDFLVGTHFIMHSRLCFPRTVLMTNVWPLKDLCHTLLERKTLQFNSVFHKSGPVQKSFSCTLHSSFDKALANL